MSSTAKRRKISSQDSDESNPPDSGSTLPVFDANLFRMRLAAFILCTPGRNGWVYKQIRKKALPQRLPRPPAPATAWTIASLIQYCASNKPQPQSMFYRGRGRYGVLPYQDAATIVYKLAGALKNGVNAERVSRQRSVRPALSPPELLAKLLSRYSTAHILKFATEFGPPNFVSASKKFGKGALVVALAHLASTGTMPQQRREEESLALKEVNLDALDFAFCGIRVPKEVVAEILSYLPYDIHLIQSVGVATFDFYALVLSTWRAPVIVNKSALFAIPKLVFRVAESVIVDPGTKTGEKLVVAELKALCTELSTNSLRTLDLKRCDDVNAVRLVKLLRANARRRIAAERRVFVNLQTLNLPVFGLGNALLEAKANATIRLSDFAPNLEVIRNLPTFSWAKKLSRVTTLRMSIITLLTDQQTAKCLGKWRIVRLEVVDDADVICFKPDTPQLTALRATVSQLREFEVESETEVVWNGLRSSLCSSPSLVHVGIIFLRTAQRQPAWDLWRYNYDDQGNSTKRANQLMEAPPLPATVRSVRFERVGESNIRSLTRLCHTELTDIVIRENRRSLNRYSDYYSSSRFVEEATSKRRVRLESQTECVSADIPSRRAFFRRKPLDDKDRRKLKSDRRRQDEEKGILRRGAYEYERVYGDTHSGKLALKPFKWFIETFVPASVPNWATLEATFPSSVGSDFQQHLDEKKVPSLAFAHTSGYRNLPLPPRLVKGYTWGGMGYERAAESIWIWRRDEAGKPLVDAKLAAEWKDARRRRIESKRRGW